MIEILYQARDLVELPRIDVRITDPENPAVLGTALKGGCAIWIPAATVEGSDLVGTVLHEVLHAVLGMDHVDGCPLMDAYSQPGVTEAEYWRLFVGYMTDQRVAVA